MLTRKRKADAGAELDQPKIHVAPSGRRYVDPEELLRSKPAQDLIQEMAKFSFKRDGPPSR